MTKVDISKEWSLHMAILESLPPLPEARIVSHQVDGAMELRTYSGTDMKEYAAEAVKAALVERIFSPANAPAAPARTELVARLDELRAQAIANGMHLVSIDEINAEVASARGAAPVAEPAGYTLDDVADACFRAGINDPLWERISIELEFHGDDQAANPSTQAGG